MSRTTRISIDNKTKGSSAKVLEKKLKAMGYGADVRISKVYTLDYDFTDQELEKIASALHNPVVEKVRIDSVFGGKFDWALELGFLPGVTDNVANTVTEMINDMLKKDIGLGKVFSSKVIFLSGELAREDVEKIAEGMVNTLIERYHVKSGGEYDREGGMDKVVPRVHLSSDPRVLEVDLDISDEALAELGKKGIPDTDGTRRGPLALDLDYLHAIQEYYKKEGRKATDIELESIAQTWSEHCKHTIFAAQMDDIEEGIFKRFIRGATEKVRADLGEDDFCLSVFKDNSGGIVFDDEYMVTDKAETHNSPSALDPLGGSVTGIVGVNRDTMGFGLGALPIVNKFGFCVGRPEDERMVYRARNKTNPALSPKRILDGVVAGVNIGGNCSGIPTPTGFVYFDDCYRGKPLIFVGTIGLIPRKLRDGRLSHEKEAVPGDNIVVMGGRVGKDGIHGATFSSEALDSGSPATAVQIGDPITQKKMSDALIKEARDRGLYNSITDNGAGGLSCSVAEMAKECGGFVVDLDKVPLKYPGLQPWEIWISESQERMTLSVPDDRLEELMDLMSGRGVNAWVIGRFNDTDRAVVRFNGKKIFDLDMDFLHNGLPKRKLVTSPYPYAKDEPEIAIEDHLSLFKKLLSSHNNCGFGYISRQYDHEVQNTCVVKPLQGKGEVNAPASVVKPLYDSDKGLVMSQCLLPRLSEISCYDMAACAIDTAIRNAVAAGGNIDHMALMDNFCWCSSDEPKRLAQLKDTARACYDYATAFRTPFISGKDSMFNDFKGYDADGNPVKISVLPTLMVSSLSVIDDVQKTCTIDFKADGDLVYVIGETRDECGGSEFYHAFGKTGANSPKVDAKSARRLYEKMRELHESKLLSACASVGAGGLGLTLAKMSIAGGLGAQIDLAQIDLPVEKALYSETQSRFIVTVFPKDREKFEEMMQGFFTREIGRVGGNEFRISDVLSTSVSDLEQVYKKRFGGY